uniref:C-type lectin domain-containing protein n=1 Tax=Oreochromis niloticus TaxID=8128 RepID=A0A669DHK6_ORENI
MKISALRFLILTVLFKLALGILPGHNHYVSIKMTWSEARTYCREHYTDLSSINNQEDEDALLQLSSLVDSDSKEEVDALLQQDSWIGLYSDDNETWKWSGGTNASFFNWANERNTPVNKICVVSSKSGWLKQNCENKFTFFLSKMISSLVALNIVKSKDKTGKFSIPVQHQMIRHISKPVTLAY